jgi:hypothetical protein
MYHTPNTRAFVVYHVLATVHLFEDGPVREPGVREPREPGGTGRNRDILFALPGRVTHSGLATQAVIDVGHANAARIELEEPVADGVVTMVTV